LVGLQTPIKVAAELMAHHGVRCVLVVDGDAATGVGLYSAQAVLAAVATGIDTAVTPIRTGMVRSIPTLHRGDSLAVALGLLSRTALPGFPVLDDQGQPCGFLCRQRLAEVPWLQSKGLGQRLTASPPDEDPGLAMITHVHYQLLNLHRHNRLQVYQRCLKLMGSLSGASRAALFKIHYGDSAEGFVSLRTAWEQPGLPALLGEARFQNIPHSALQRWHHSLAKGRIIQGMRADFPAVEQTFLTTLEAESVLLVPLRYRSRYFGFLLFTRCPHLGPWDAEAIKLLRTAAISLSLSFEQSYTQKRLKETETAFASLFQHIPDPIAITTFPEGRYLLVNQGYAQWLSYDEADLIGKHPRDLGLLHNRRQFVQLRRQLLQTGWIKNAEIDTHTPDGQVKTLLVSSELTEFQSQTCLLSIGKDITERKQTQVAISAAEARFRAIFEQANVAICQADLAGNLVEVNPGMCRMLDYRREELTQKTFQDITHPDDLGADLIQYQQLLAGTLASMTIEKRYLHRDGHAIWVTLTVCLVRDDQGESLFSLGVSQDITERYLAYQQVEHQIRREQALNRVIQAIRQSLDLDTIFTTAAREVAHLLQVDHVHIQRYQSHSLVWQVVAEYRTQPDQVSLLNQVGTAGETAITQRLQRLDIVALTAADTSPPLVQALPGCWLLVPLAVSDAQPWGCLGIHRPAPVAPASATAETLGEPAVWQASEVELVSTVADQLAIAIQQAQTLEQARHDLEERQRAEARLKEAQRIAHTGNWELRLPHRTLLWSEEMFRIYGLEPHTRPLTLEDQLAALEDGDHHQWQYHFAMACMDGQALNLEGSIRRPDGVRRVVQLLGHPQRNEDGEMIGLVGTLTDITERKQVEERLAYEALHDPLTGIPNRAYFMEQLNVAVQGGRTAPNPAFAVLFIDLDRFKVINDSLGHLVGDQLLIECAHRLGSVVREGDLVARLGGDEFAILIHNIANLEEPVAVAQRIHEVLQVPVLLEGREVFISASVGVSSNLTGSMEAVDFLRDADTAMYQAKHNGRGQSALFDPQMYEEVATQLTLENDLQRALERQELRLEYQPIVALHSAQVVGFEALVRWHHPRWGVISPSTFIPLAEETGLILSIGEWTQRTACQQLQQWRQRLPQAADLMMSVNLSVKQFANPHLIASIDEALANAHLSPYDLRLEITESALIENPETAESLLADLQERGLQICIDDFGTGYSSLSMVHRFPVQILKIDRSFTSRLEDDPRGVAMVQSILALAHSLGMIAIAEGVETLTQWHVLQDLGCTYGQGYYIATPMTGADVEAFLLGWPNHPSGGNDAKTT
jgi:diguanylate cyclase (GGDEF)-like protein/PAS domain S-box-containing protein